MTPEQKLTDEEALNLAINLVAGRKGPQHPATLKLRDMRDTLLSLEAQAKEANALREALKTAQIDGAEAALDYVAEMNGSEGRHSAALTKKQAIEILDALKEPR